jgi:hypothetical protein
VERLEVVVLTRSVVSALRGDDLERFEVCVAAGLVDVGEFYGGKSLLERAYDVRARRIFRFLVSCGVAPAKRWLPNDDGGFFGRLVARGDLSTFRWLLPLLVRVEKPLLFRYGLLMVCLRARKFEFAAAVVECDVGGGKVPFGDEVLSQLLDYRSVPVPLVWFKRIIAGVERPMSLVHSVTLAIHAGGDAGWLVALLDEFGVDGLAGSVRELSASAFRGGNGVVVGVLAERGLLVGGVGG